MYVASIFRFAGPSRLSCVVFITFSLQLLHQDRRKWSLWTVHTIQHL